MPTWINDRGDWGAWAKCPEDAPAVCGIKSRIDNGYPNRYFATSIGQDNFTKLIDIYILFQFDSQNTYQLQIRSLYDPRQKR